MTADLAAFLLACLRTDKQVEMNAPTAATYKRSFRLADIAAKKAIVELHRVIPSAYPGAVIGDLLCCEVCSVDGEYPVTGEFPCRTLRLLAQPYKGRPGWSDEWSL